MAQEQFATLASSVLAEPMTPTQTTMVVQSASSFPQGAGQFRVRVGSEIMIATSPAGPGNAFAVQRAQEGTFAASGGYPIGAAVRLVLTAASLVLGGLSQPTVAPHVGVRDGQGSIPGAAGDGRRVTDAVIALGSHSLASASADFLQFAGTKLCTLYGVGSSTVQHGTCTWVSATQVTTSFASTVDFSGGGGVFRWGTDDTAAIGAAITAAKTASAAGLTTQPAVYFGPGEYMVTAGFDLDSTCAGVSLRGTPNTISGYSTFARIVLMAPASFLVRDRCAGGDRRDVWFDGNRLATDTLSIQYGTVDHRWIGCRMTGAIQNNIHFGNDFGELEIDFISFHDCGLAGDFYDRSYHSATNVYNENGEAFQIDFHRGISVGAGIHFHFFLGSCNVYGTQAFAWDTAFCQVDTYASGFVLQGIYNEQDTAPFLRVVATAGASTLGTIVLRDILIQNTGIYTEHTQAILLQNVRLAGDLTSNPAAAIIGGVAYGIQPVICDDLEFINSTDVIYESGIPGQLVRGTFRYGASTRPSVTDGSMSTSSPKALNFGSVHSTLVSAQSVGYPITVVGAGAGGADFNGWVVAYVGTTQLTVQDQNGNGCSTNVSNAKVYFGTTGTYAGDAATGTYAVQITRPASQSKIVNAGGTAVYDANGLMLGCGQCPVGPGVPIVAADAHYVTGITTDRSTTISNLGAQDVGMEILVTRKGSTDGHTYTVNYANGSIGLTTGWAVFMFIPNLGWGLVAGSAS